MEKQKNQLINYTIHPECPVSVDEVAKLLESVDEQLPDPLRSRSYFTSYKALAERFVKQGLIPCARLPDGSLIGCAVLYADKLAFRRAYETFIGVHPGYFHRGIATKLMKMEIDLSRACGISGMMTNCNPSNTAKINLNTKIGFRRVTDPEEYREMVAINPKWGGKLFFVLDF